MGKGKREKHTHTLSIGEVDSQEGRREGKKERKKERDRERRDMEVERYLNNGAFLLSRIVVSNSLKKAICKQ